MAVPTTGSATTSTSSASSSDDAKDEAKLSDEWERLLDDDLDEEEEEEEEERAALFLRAAERFLPATAKYWSSSWSICTSPPYSEGDLLYGVAAALRGADSGPFMPGSRSSSSSSSQWTLAVSRG